MALERKRSTSAAGPVKTGNPYLDDPEKGLGLVAAILSRKPAQDSGQRKRYRRVDYLLDQRLLSYTEKLDLKHELQLYSELVSLSDRLRLPEKYRILQQRAVIGLGGMFSAGKSCFINSILGDDFQYQLPVNQNPSTSVPTYIVSGKRNEVRAYTRKGAQFSLDDRALEAISHDFAKVYGLGLAQYMSFIAVFAQGFRSDIALLDTPGYNKPDNSVVEAYSDAQKAFSQLQAVDYLIWLIDVQNGTLQNADIELLQKLKLRTKILFVVNKCDLETDHESVTVEKSVRQAAMSAGLPVFDVIRYASTEPDSYHGRENVQRFFQYAHKRESRVEDIQQQFRSISNQLETAFTETEDERVKVRDKLGRLILRADNIFEIPALVSMYGNVNSDISAIRENRRGFQKAEKDILSIIDYMLKEGGRR